MSDYLRLTICEPTDCSTPGYPVHYQLPELTQTHVHWVGDFIQTSHFLICFSSRLQSFPESGSFPNESVLCNRWLNYWIFSVSISSSNELSGLISFRMDWLDLLAVQGTLKSFLQHHSSNVNSPLTQGREQQCSSLLLFLSLRTRINEPIHRTVQELDQKETF